MSLTKNELEQKVVNLEKRFEEVMGAIRKLAQQQTSNLGLLSRHETEIAALRMELKRVESKMQEKTIHENKIERYE